MHRDYDKLAEIDRNDNIFDIFCKVVVVGRSSVGKSSLIARYMKAKDQEVKMTLGTDWYTKLTTVDDKTCKVRIWDTAGQERFRALTTSYFRDANGALLVYDVTSEASFDDIPDWLMELDAKAGPNCVKMLVGNKCDQESARKISKESASEFAKKHNISFSEASALTDTHVTPTFEELIVNIIRKQTEPPSQKNKIDLTSKKSRVCCF